MESFNRNRLWYLISGLVLLALIYSLFRVSPPRNFPIRAFVTVRDGSGLVEVANELHQDRVIRSPAIFRNIAILLGGERGMQAGEYYLYHPMSVFEVAWRIVNGKYGLPMTKLTVPEGFTVKKISVLFDEKFLFFDNTYFEQAAPEGYLFPDTYFVPLSISASSTIRLLRNNFVRKIFPLMPGVESSGRTLEEIIKMASIVENEANNQKDREIVSGILWKRYDRGIPLQVDASFIFVNGKTTAELTTEDLKIKSPYNTYLNKGFPPTPISNSGLESIQAALHPATSTFLYFLTGHDGRMYYSKTFDEHVKNKQKYLYR